MRYRPPPENDRSGLRDHVRGRRMCSAPRGILARRKRLFRLADGRTMGRNVGYCIVEAEGFATNDEIVFAEPGDMHRLGGRTLEGFGVMVDPIGHRFVTTITPVARAARVARPANAFQMCRRACRRAVRAGASRVRR